ncbi:hypothetical protein AVL59_20370 [Streptomyces griseochromogenes]|uniref:Uncharacterized protein n=1 Tax=Streptomyces griseochromogenes TaxID=68214 RepID=A0A1B1AYI3_9ACTN|nr:hypothetical protein AVL59_20370 [Streptomyces griseochromogenes]
MLITRKSLSDCSSAAVWRLMHLPASYLSLCPRVVQMPVWCERILYLLPFEARGEESDPVVQAITTPEVPC